MRQPDRWAVQLFAGLALFACASLPPEVPVAASPEGDVIDTAAAELQILALINAYRESHDLPRLTQDPIIADVARLHSQAMLRGEAPFSHAGLTERKEKIAESIEFVHIAENLFTIEPPSMFTPWRVVRSWLRSEQHRVEIEGCFDTTGIGVAANDKEVYVTQIFVLRSRVLQEDARNSSHPCRSDRA